MRVIGAYAATDNSTAEVKETFYDQLAEVLAKTANRAEVLVLEYFNAGVGNRVN